MNQPGTSQKPGGDTATISIAATGRRTASRKPHAAGVFASAQTHLPIRPRVPPAYQAIPPRGNPRSEECLQ